MPLVVARRKDTGTLWITGTVKPAGAKVGRRVRQRAGSNDAATAREEAAAIEARILRDFHHGAKQSAYTFAEACQSYLTHQERSAGTKAVVRRLVLHWRSTSLGAIDQEAVDGARTKILRAGASNSTWRKTVAILSAIINHAARRKWCDPAAFDLPSPSQGRTRFLLPDEYDQLHAAATDHLRPLLTYLVCTGSRLGEALALDWQQVDLRAGRVNVWADQTKAGKRRLVDLPPAAVRALSGMAHRDGPVFRTNRGEPYRPSADGYGGQIKTAWRAACAKAGIEHATPHDLRHTWASYWYRALTPDPFRLQQAGGWSSVELVARYAHLVPEGHAAAIRRIYEGT